MTIENIETNLSSVLHGGTLSKVRNKYEMFERVQNTVLSKIDPIETERLAPLAQIIHDDLNNYSLPSDFKEIIDLYPQADRSISDKGERRLAESFDIQRAISNKTLTIEGSEGTKFLRVNWKSKAAVVFHNMNSLTDNGTWAIVATATGLKLNKQIKYSGSASIEFDVAADGDGIQISDASAIDREDEDELDDILFAVYIPDVTNLTGFTVVFGNDLTTAYWSCVAQTTQADGTAWRNGWNIVKSPWSTATETGTVDPEVLDSMKITIQATDAIANIKVDNILFSLGTAFDIKYYSQYCFKNSSGVWISKPTDDSDVMVLQGTAEQIFLMESLKAAAQQIEGEDSVFDITYANRELNGDPTSPDRQERMGLYAKYRAEYPSMSKKAVQRWSSGPRFRNRYYR